MKILVANLGSTSFKFRLFDMNEELQLARGSVDRIGLGGSHCVFSTGGNEQQVTQDIASHAEAVQVALERLVESGVVESLADVDGIGFKAVHGGSYSGVQRVNDTVLDQMHAVSAIAPAHNPI